MGKFLALRGDESEGRPAESGNWHDGMFGSEALILTCSTLNPVAPPTPRPTVTPTCFGHGLYLEDRNDGEYTGWYNVADIEYDDTGKKVWQRVRPDGKYELIFVDE